MLPFKWRRKSMRQWPLAVLSGVILLHAWASGAERLRGEPSAFLQLNASSPVDWAPWGEDAFARAKREQKPVFVAVGAFLNELSDAMRQQTFARSETAEFLNRNFVCVLVDREEHPEVAAMLFAYLARVKQSGGWPLNVWLTPELLPYEGGAYLPPSDEWGKPGFMKVAQQAKQAWANDPAGCRERAGEAAELLRTAEAMPARSGRVSPAALQVGLVRAAFSWRERFDGENGGFGEPPKNGEPELLRFLLRQSGEDREAALLTLRRMANSGLRDPLDGGFFRGASDPAWNVPILQKTLMDQARLALAYLDGAKSSAADGATFRTAARGALDYALLRLALPDGTFAASEDGTTGESSRYYSWTAEEIDTLLGKEAATFRRAHGVESSGNVPAEWDAAGHFTGKNLLRSKIPDTPLGVERLRAARGRRRAPLRDDRGTSGAHGMLLAALARAGEEVNEPRYRAAAKNLFHVIDKEFLLSSAGELRRLRGAGFPASPADYAAVILGCRTFARTAEGSGAGASAEKFLAALKSRYLHSVSGSYVAAPEVLPPGLFFRPPALQEALMTEALLLLASSGVAGEGTLSLEALLDVLAEGNEAVPGDILLALSLLR
ncbi:MAG: DUF255 domain-containing protein [Opitutaceae bacterium]